jgi:E3 ubiquitin-protein ligase DOA10
MSSKAPKLALKKKNTLAKKESVSIDIPAAIPPTCRICQEGEGSRGKESLLTPCNCKGVFSHAHSSCLSSWIEAYDMPYCDICHFQYIVDKRPHTFRDWIKLQGKTDEYQQAFMVFLTSLYNFFLSSIIFWVSYGKIWPTLSFLLSGCTLFWFVYMSGGLFITLTREYRSYKEWSTSHFRYIVHSKSEHRT